MIIEYNHKSGYNYKSEYSYIILVWIIIFILFLIREIYILYKRLTYKVSLKTNEFNLNSKLALVAIPYSEKSFVIRGDTKKYKDKLKALGGRWNRKLLNGPGWIFSNKKKSSELLKLIQTSKTD